MTDDAKKVRLTGSLINLPIWGSNFRDKHDFEIFNTNIEEVLKAVETVN